MHTVATHTAPTDTTAHLTFAAEFLEHIKFESRLAAARGPKSTRGRKSRLGQYKAHGIAAAMYEVVAADRPYTLKAVFDRLWFEYTDEQMDLIGLGDLRTPERVIAMKPALGADRKTVDAAVRTTESEYQRFHAFIQEAFAPMDDTPLVANHRKENRPTVAKVKAAAAKPELAPKTSLKGELLNALVIAALKVDNERRYPGTTLHNGGILADHRGDLAIDETHLAVGVWALAKNIAPGNFMARTHGNGKIYDGSPALIGLTLAVAVPGPDQQHAPPLVCLGASIHHPTGGLGPAALNIVDAIDTNDARAPRPSNRPQYVVVDGGYTKAKRLNRSLTTRGYGMVMQYAKDHKALHEIGGITHEDGTRTPGIRLFNGRPLCPGASLPQLARTKLRLPVLDARNRKPHQVRVVKPDDYGKALIDHDTEVKKIIPFVMGTNGRPKETLNRSRGGQAKNAPAPETVMQVTLTCPHVKGTARCAIMPDYDDPAIAHLPSVPAPPGDLPFHQRPACCENPSGTINAKIPLKAFKDWQDFMPGTWEHEDWHFGPRSANERFNSMIKRPTSGSSLDRCAIGPRKAAPYALFTAMAIINTNRLTIETREAGLLLRGTKPTTRVADNRSKRDQARREYLAQHPNSRRRRP